MQPIDIPISVKNTDESDFEKFGVYLEVTNGVFISK
jgi:hypothetical protein